MKLLKQVVLALGCAALVVAVPVNSALAAHSATPKSELDKVIGRCMVTVGVGAVLGGILGNQSHSRNGGMRGALAGAAIGGALCAVMVKVAKDKDAILERQRAAVATGQYQNTSFTGNEGTVTVATRVRNVEPQVAAQGPTRLCRYADTTVGAEGAGAATLPSQLYCRDAQGDWQIADASSVSKNVS
jgi:hypothetical protein